MGLVNRVVLFVLLLFSVYLSAWIIAVPIVAYFLILLFHRKKGKEAIIIEKERKTGLFGRFAKRYIVGALFLVLSVIAYEEGGRFSVSLFFGLGLVMVLSGIITSSSIFSRVEPVRESILLRKPAVPFKWLSLAEIKTAGKKLSTVLTTLEDEVVIQRGEKLGVYVVLETFSFGRASAESTLLKRMKRVSRSLAPLGAYLLPLDSKEVIARFSARTGPEKIETEDWPTSFEAVQFDLLTLNPKGGFLESVGAYTLEEGEARFAMIPPPRQHLRIQPLFWETLEALDKRMRLPEPDSYTSFLSNLFSARNTSVGEILESSDSKDDGSVIVRCLSSPPVELSRPQLRALVRVYSGEVGKTTH